MLFLGIFGDTQQVVRPYRSCGKRQGCVGHRALTVHSLKEHFHSVLPSVCSSFWACEGDQHYAGLAARVIEQIS